MSGLINDFKELLSIAMALSGALALFSGCGFQKTGGANSQTLLGSGSYVIVDPALNSQALGILNMKCQSCHANGANDGGFGNVNSLDAMILTGMIYPGNAAASRVYIRSADGTMPPRSPLSGAEAQVIKSWIDVGLRPEASTSPGGGGGFPAPPPVIPLEPKFSSIFSNILKPKCVSCHGSTKAASGIRYDTYAYTLKTVKPRNASDSPLYSEVATKKMPPRSALSAAEVTAIRDWINTGAANN